MLSGTFLFQGDLWAESALTGQGYAPLPSDLEELTVIDSRIHLLLPDRDVLSVRDPPTGPELTQVRMKWHQGLNFSSSGFTSAEVLQMPPRRGSCSQVISVGQPLSDTQGVTPMLSFRALVCFSIYGCTMFSIRSSCKSPPPFPEDWTHY